MQRLQYVLVGIHNTQKAQIATMKPGNIELI